MKTAFLTGGTGFVGSALARTLQNNGWRVRALARRHTNRDNLQGLMVDIVEGDLSDETILTQGMQGCDALFHVAADYRLWALDPQDIYRTNVGGTARIMHAALNAGIKRVVYTSSIATLGQVSGGIADEKTPVSFDDMIGDYKKSKYLAEQEVLRMTREEELPAIIVNPSMPVGPRDRRPTASGRLILTAAMGKMPLYTSSTGLNIAHVDDVAKGHLQAFKHGKIGEKYILGGENLSLGKIVRAITVISGKRAPWGSVSASTILPLAYICEFWARLRRSQQEPLITVTGTRLAKKKMYFSSRKAQKAIQYAHRPAREAFTDAITWFRNNGYC